MRSVPSVPVLLLNRHQHPSKLNIFETGPHDLTPRVIVCRDLDELQRSFKERYSRLLEKRLRTERDARLLEQAAPGSTGREPAPPADSRGGGSRGRSAGSEEGGM